MVKLHNSWQRIGWLVFIEILKKRRIFSLILLAAFGYLMILFIEPTMSIGNMINMVFQSERSVISGTYNVTTYSYSTVIPIFTEAPNHPLKFHINSFPASLFLVGIIITSLSFIEYGDLTSRRFYMTVPAALSEKWLSKLIISTFIFPVFYLSVYQIFAIATYQWGHAQGKEYVRLDFWDPLVWTSIGTYMMIQCFVFLFSIIYQKYSFAKLILTFIGAYFLFALILNLSLIIFLPDYHTFLPEEYSYRHNLFDWHNYNGFLNQNSRRLSSSWSPWLHSIESSYFIAVSASFALFLSFLRFKELEA